MKNQINIDELVRKSAEVFEVNLEDVLSVKRDRYIVNSRRAVFYILKTHYKISELNISRLIGGKRDHSTIIHSNLSTNDILDTDYDFAFNYKRYFEYVTKLEYLRPLPVKYNTWHKKKIIYRYYTDAMIAKSALGIDTKLALLSEDFKKKVSTFIRENPSVYRTSNEFGISRRLVTEILAEDTK